MLLTVIKMAAAIQCLFLWQQQTSAEKIFFESFSQRKTFSQKGPCSETLPALALSVSGRCLWCWNQTWQHYGIFCCLLPRNQPFKAWKSDHLHHLKCKWTPYFPNLCPDRAPHTGCELGGSRGSSKILIWLPNKWYFGHGFPSKIYSKRNKIVFWVHDSWK